MNLTGQLLVAMPGMGDPRFEGAVIYICAHSGDGALGLIVNKRAADMSLADVLDQLGIGDAGRVSCLGVYIGGPVEMERGFVLHSDDYRAPAQTLTLPGGFGMTATQEILEHVAAGTGPRKLLFMLGYSGWGPGQLEAEIGRNGWLTCAAAQTLVFRKDEDAKWAAALKSLGVDPLSLSSAAGRA